LLSWGVFIVRTVYFDHAGLRYPNFKQNASNGRSSAIDEKEIERLRNLVAFHQNNITTQEPVFINIRDLLSAFAGFRIGLNKESCVVRVTAPIETVQFASVVAAFSTATSNCPTFGPSIDDRDSDEATITTSGMVSDAIVFHAARDDEAANMLFSNLTNLVKLVRKYDLPKPNYQTPEGGYQHTVWLQFGDKVKWNSERYHP
jgi:hypothetical protein